MKIVLSVSALIVALAIATAVVTKIVGHHPTNCRPNPNAFASGQVCTESPGLW
jgi:hypothetical protein